MRIIANSLPKAGTHLLVRFLQLAGYEYVRKGLTGALIRSTQRNPIKRYLTSRKRCTSNDSGCYQIDLDNLGNRIKKKYLDSFINSIPENSFIPAHLPYSEELDCYLSAQRLKVIYIIRDPRDVLLSYYNHQHRDPRYPFHDVFRTLPFEQCYQYILRGMKKGNITLASIKSRVENSIGWFTSDNVIGIRFEDLVGEKGGGTRANQINAIQKILSYLEIGSTNSGVERIADHLFYSKARTFFKG